MLCLARETVIAAAAASSIAPTSSRMPPSDLTQALTAAFPQFAADWAAILLGWARVSPSLLLVPAFGGSALPLAARGGLGLALGVAMAPALRPAALGSTPFPLQLAREVAIGTPPAIGAALLVYTALMAGGVIDDLRGARENASLPVFAGGASPLGALLGLLVAIAFLESGGASQLIAHLTRPLAAEPVAAIAAQIAAAIGIAIAAAAPLLVAAIVISVAEALVARAAVPAHVSSLLSPLRGIALLGIAALVLDRIVALLALLSAR